MKRGKVTDVEREQIRMFSTARMAQKAIAKELRLTRQTVGRIQRELGLSPHPGGPLPKEIEGRIIELLAKNHGVPRIARELAVAPHKVQAIIKKIHHRKPFGKVGHRYHLGTLELRAIRRDIRKSEGAIARKYGVTHAWLRGFRLRMWSNSGDKHWKRRKREAAIPAGPDGYVMLVQRACKGNLPATDDAKLVAAMMHAFALTTLEGQPQPVLDSFARGLGEAIHTLRTAENSTWTN